MAVESNGALAKWQNGIGIYFQGSDERLRHNQFGLIGVIGDKMERRNELGVRIGLGSRASPDVTDMRKVDSTTVEYKQKRIRQGSPDICDMKRTREANQDNEVQNKLKRCRQGSPDICDPIHKRCRRPSAAGSDAKKSNGDDGVRRNGSIRKAKSFDVDFDLNKDTKVITTLGPINSAGTVECPKTHKLVNAALNDDTVRNGHISSTKGGYRTVEASCVALHQDLSKDESEQDLEKIITTASRAIENIIHPSEFLQLVPKIVTLEPNGFIREKGNVKAEYDIECPGSSIAKKSIVACTIQDENAFEIKFIEQEAYISKEPSVDNEGNGYLKKSESPEIPNTDLLCHEEIEDDPLSMCQGEPGEPEAFSRISKMNDVDVSSSCSQPLVRTEIQSEDNGVVVALERNINDNQPSELSGECDIKSTEGEECIKFCQNCGCYGLKSEFYEVDFCTRECHNTFKRMSVCPGKMRKSETPKKFTIMDPENKNFFLQKEYKNENQDNNLNSELLETVNSKFSAKKKSKSTKQRKKPKTRTPTKDDTEKLRVSKLKDSVVARNKSSQPVKPNLQNNDFDWTKYLQDTKAKSAPLRLFREPALPPENPFRIGMVFEAIDPQHQSLICVVSVQEVLGYRMRLRFEGFSEAYDFWTNADSVDIFPARWCQENDLELQPPPGVAEPFDWESYAEENNLLVASRELFAVTKEEIAPDDGVKPGMKLEAVDIRNQNLVCVATVAKVMGERILVHFDSWDSIYDYWTDFTSPFIHPVGWCAKNSVKLVPPNHRDLDFVWESYMKETNSEPVPANLFRPLPPIPFKKGFKVECVDKRNPSLIRVATVSEVSNHSLGIHFDNWPDIYDYSVYELSPDIHPLGWCAHTGHPIQMPPPLDVPWKGPCSVFGCTGVGHIKGPKFITHSGEKNCPYALHNYKKDLQLPDRISVMERSYGHGLNDNSSSVESCVLMTEKISLGSQATKGKPLGNSGKSSSPAKVLSMREKRASVSAVSEIQPKRIRVNRKCKSSFSSRTPSPGVENLGLSESDGGATPSSNCPPVINFNETEVSRMKEISESRKELDSEEKICPKKSPPKFGNVADSEDVAPNASEEIPVNLVANSVSLKTVVGKLREETVASWKVEQLSTFISTIPGCEHTAQTFLDQLIDGESFLMLSQKDFLDVMKLKLGPAIKLCNVIKIIKQSSQ